MNQQQQYLCDGLERLRQNEGSYADFTILSEEGKTFHCHRVVLAAVSPFFDTMFTSDMKETARKAQIFNFLRKQWI
ncbi:hypothetical protein DPMN_064746 [Dreissena polymorpha]|uniref:BTB domain-containing protein n=1 Tax=Dreissena polymorpha TaxID=45954 RepID=A0A9D4CED6_DREPO|nr:hypothetical protein DPMN_064746 [Dreissena polymorpha]